LQLFLIPEDCVLTVVIRQYIIEQCETVAKSLHMENAYNILTGKSEGKR
jgi:hypothetical protein